MNPECLRRCALEDDNKGLCYEPGGRDPTDGPEGYSHPSLREDAKVEPHDAFNAEEHGEGPGDLV